MTNENTEKMRAVLTEMLKAQYNPPSVAGANADDIITRFEVEGLLGSKQVKIDVVSFSVIEGYIAAQYLNGIGLIDENDVSWIVKDGMWVRS